MNADQYIKYVVIGSEESINLITHALMEMGFGEPSGKAPLNCSLEELSILLDMHPDLIIDFRHSAATEVPLLKWTQSHPGSYIAAGSAQVLEALAKSRRVFGQLRRASQDLLSEKPLHELLILLLNSCLSVVNARGGGIFLLDQETQKPGLEVVFPHDERLISCLKRVKDSNSGKYLNELTKPSVIRDGPSSVLSIPLSLERKNINAIVSLVKKNNDFNGQEIGLVHDLIGQLRTAVENTLLYKEKEEQSRIDGLTGLRNRREFEERLEEELIRSQRYDLTFSLALIDLDQFKQYNDTKGHLAGDLLLKQIASTLKESMRGSDMVARYGGDEFVVILPETGKQGAVFGCERLREKVQEKFGPDITASIGVATFPDDAVLKKALLEKADSALYRAKREGKNRTVVAER